MLERLDQLAALTDEQGLICRTFLSPAMREANALAGGWMKEIGGEVEVDGWGNLVGHFPGTGAGARTLLIGSHLDTVRNAGKFDGPLGVVVAIASLEALAVRGVRLPFHVDIAGFSDEEGARFHSAYLGSKAIAGLMEEADLDLCDAQGVSIREALAAFQGRKDVALPKTRYAPGQLLGYVEVHIEQGPVLQDKGLALGVVGHIAAQCRFTATVEGCAGHAGTTPMELRRDALAGAAELILAVEKLGRRTAGLVATVGQIEARPGASNVIPGQVRLSIDVRHAEAGVLREACAALAREADGIAVRRDLAIGLERIQETAPVACAPELVRQLERTVLAQQEIAPVLVSGAGHDAVILSRVAPVGMLFVRCRDGISHHPDEDVTEADLAAAVTALTHFLENFA